jgi:pimeloyl-ACP methyl ester carboxylesterase
MSMAGPVHVRYLHGFASSPATTSKGRWLAERLAGRIAGFDIPDLQNGPFFDLTMDRLVASARAAVDAVPDDGAPLVLVGSSLGGYVAATLAAEGIPRLAGLACIAPAFGFPQRWRQRLGDEAITAWRAEGSRLFYHYGEEQELPLGSGFLDSCEGLPASPAGVALPTVAICGRQDEQVGWRAAWDWMETCPRGEFHLLEGGHALDDERHLTAIGTAVESLLDRLDETLG